MHRIRRMRGFTLLELMIVVAVVAILASIAVPAYQDSVRKGRRGQAKADLMEAAQLMERFRTVNNTYEGFVLPFTTSPKDGTARYTLAVSDASAVAYELSATPISGSGQDEDRCGTLVINQAGVRSIEDAESGATAAACF